MYPWDPVAPVSQICDSRGMDAKHDHGPLTRALARAATRLVAEARVGSRRGSVAAVARAMTERGVPTSKSTLSRKLDGAYPFNTDEIGVLADVLGVRPDAIWRDALALMGETGDDARSHRPDATQWERIAERNLDELTPEAAAEVRRVAGVTRPAAEGEDKRREVS